MPTKPIKVLHVIARLNIGGTARYLHHLIPRLRNENVDVLLAVGRIQEGEVEDSSLQDLEYKRIESLGRRVDPINDLKSYLALRRIVKEFNPDIIHSHTFKAGLLSRLMFIKIPKVHTFHGHLLTDPEFSKFEVKIICIIERLLSKITKKLIVTGDQVAKDLLLSKIGEENKYISIPGELEIKPLRSRREARYELGIGNTFAIFWLARMATVKQPKLFIEVARMCPEFIFVMCGEGSELESMKSHAPSNLKFLGMINPADYLSAADVFVSTSANEGIPYSIMEAQAAGLPVVAVDSGAISEIVEDGINGFLTRADAEELAFRIIELNMNEKLRTKLGSAAATNSNQRLMKPRISRSHSKVYSGIIRK